jgi:hypothetical protein
MLVYPQRDSLVDEMLERSPSNPGEFRLISLCTSPYFVEGIEKIENTGECYVNMKSVIFCMD